MQYEISENSVWLKPISGAQKRGVPIIEDFFESTAIEEENPKSEIIG